MFKGSHTYFSLALSEATVLKLKSYLKAYELGLYIFESNNHLIIK